MSVYIQNLKISLVRDGSQKAETRKVSNSRDVYTLARERLETADREYFEIFLMDRKNQVRGIHTVSIGSLSASIVHPREVFKAAIVGNAAAIICVHNHPSGDPRPSPEDKEITRRLREAGKIIGIEVLDHIVIGDGQYFSFADEGLI